MKMELRSPTTGGDRRWTRHQSTDVEVLLWIDAERSVRGTVVDESFGGLGIVFDEAPPIREGQQFEVAYGNARVWAAVRNLTVDADGNHRLGLEWKAVGLATWLRETAKASATADDGDDNSLARLKQILPAGLYTMWRLFETSHWFELGEMADRLGRDATAAGVHELSTYVERLKESAQVSSPKAQVGRALGALIDQCIRLVAEEESVNMETVSW